MTTVGTLINIHQALVIPVVLGLMWNYGDWRTEAYVYLALHGTYSLLWLMKQSYYPDPRFAQKLPVWIGLLTVFLPLAGYYLTPYLLISPTCHPSSLRIGNRDLPLHYRHFLLLCE